MDRLDGHHLVVNAYVEECLRHAQAQEAERDEALRRVHDRDSAAARLGHDVTPVAGAGHSRCQRVGQA